MSTEVDQYGANKAARARARILEENSSVIPLLEPLFPYTVIAPPIHYFKNFINEDEPVYGEFPPMGW